MPIERKSGFAGGDDEDRQVDPDVIGEAELPELQQLGEELRAAGYSSDDEIEDAVSELSEESLESYAGDLRSVLKKVGLKDPENLTSDKLRGLGGDILIQLDEFTAEALFFDTSLKVWKWLGSEGVTADQFLGRLRPPDDISHLVTSADLNQLKWDRRKEAVRWLRAVGMDEQELFTKLTGKAEEQQDVLRVAYVIQEQPALKEIRIALMEAKKNGEDSVSFSDLIEKLKWELTRLIRSVSEEMGAKVDNGELDNIHVELYQRGLEGLGAGHRILNLVGRKLDLDIEVDPGTS